MALVARRLDGDSTKIQTRLMVLDQIKTFQGFLNSLLEIGKQIHVTHPGGTPLQAIKSR
jgi:hypothetical protein